VFSYLRSSRFSLLDKSSFAGRRILVTGASSGIGRSLAIILSSQGARLVLMGRNREQLDLTLSMLSGPDHEAVTCDFIQDNDFDVLLAECAQRGKFSGLVHCAGINATLPLKVLSQKKWEEVFRVNVTSAMSLSKAFARRNISETGSSIVLLGSVMSLVGQAGAALYSSSKSALVGLSKSLALELARDRIRVNLVCPGMVKTEMLEKLSNLVGEEKMREFEKLHPLGLGNPEDVSHAIAFLLSDLSRWITGSCLVVDGGYTAW